MRLFKKIRKYLKITIKEAEENAYYAPKFFGESKSVEYEIKGLTDSFCKVTEWSNGEGFDISFETLKNVKTKQWENKNISLHTDELGCFLACLNHFKYFNRESI